jgi:uncharacterized secreted protein with C-terminal beta-propeller domain
MRVAKIMALLMIVAVLGGIAGCINLQKPEDEPDNTPYSYGDITYSNLNRFNSFQEIQDFLIYNQEQSQYNYYSYGNITKVYYGRDSFVVSPGVFSVDLDDDGASDAEGSSSSPDHSTTNVQVEGVDEGDIVKTDGKYAYIVNHNNTKVFIVEVFPAEDASIVSVIEVDFIIREIYLNGDKLVIVGYEYNNYYDYYDIVDIRGGWYPYYYDIQKTIVQVFNVEDKQNAELTRSVSLNGSYISSRLVGEYFYLIVNQYTNEVKNETDLPVPASRVYFADEYDYYYYFTAIMSLNVQDDDEETNTVVVLMGTSTHIYVSLDNIYLTYTKRMSWAEKMERRVEQVIVPTLPSTTSTEVNEILNSSLPRGQRLYKIDRVVGEYMSTLDSGEKEGFQEDQAEIDDDFERSIAKETEKTIVHRIEIDRGRIEYKTSGGVPGYILNRFSMSEHRKHFRMATTTGQVWSTGEPSRNHVFVLNLDLEIVGEITDIAPGETIYSARFMGDRGYLVTFKKIDPFFVIDLKNPTKPKILGELKIPGYSNYLHPYDENHVIGIGKDAVDMGDFAWYQGVKLSLFDVTDVKNPKEKSKFNIGDRGTESLALHDPHAFLFSKDKNLLVIPVRLFEIDQSKYPDGAPPSTHGEYKWTGAYVLHLSVDNGFMLEGRISHSEDSADPDDPWGYYYTNSIKRSFYIDDVLYTVSDHLLKANSLDDLTEISSVELED